MSVALPGGPTRIVLVIAGALALVGLSISIGAANALREGAPSLVLAWFPWDARAASLEAFERLKSGGPEDRRVAATLAKRAIARDPTLGSAFGVLGSVALADGETARAERLFAASEKVSRRDLVTQLSLIEQSVGRNDAAGALHHYDLALRTSELAPTMLYPTLLQAMSDRELIPPLAAVLAKRPAWAHPFLAEAMAKAPSVDNLLVLSAMLRARGAPLVEGLQHLLLQRLIADARYADAQRVAAGGTQARGGVNDPNFASTRDFFPFGWTLADETGRSAQRNRDAGTGSQGLTVSAGPERPGEVAGQLLVLPPGRYQLTTSGNFGKVDGQSSPVWTVTCKDPAGKPLVSVAAHTAGKRAAVPFSVPATCAAQLLSLTVRDISDPDGLSGRVDDIAITPITGVQKGL